MRDIVLIELANRWIAQADSKMSDAFESEHEMHADKAERATKRECADTLITLIGMLGDKPGG